MRFQYPKSTRIDEISNLADFVCDTAVELSASDAEVSIYCSEGQDISISNGNVETLDFKGGVNIDICLYYGHKSVLYTTSDTSKHTIEKALKNLSKRREFIEEDPYSGLPSKSLLAYDYIDLSLFFSWDLDVDQKVDLLKSCEDVALNYKSEIKQSESVALSLNKSFYYHANTYGFRASYAKTYYNLCCCLLAEDNYGEMHRDYDYIESRNPNIFDNTNEIAKSTALKTVARLGARIISSQKSRVLFSPRMSKYFVYYLLRAINGRNIYQRSSFLNGHLNEKILPDFVDILEDPHIPQGISSTYCDNDGVKTSKRFLVKAGTLNGYLLSTYTARQLNMQTTGNAGGYHNILVSANGGDLETMLCELDTGLYVIDMMGHGVNIATGDFSRGVFGFWVKSGKIQFPVHEVTIAGNLKDIYNGLIAIGNNIDNQGSIQTGSWLINSMTIAGA
ncbi:MAG: metallopeptidase TldD-related protein [Pseudomonadota bacterium]|nr:metallopeptidase TldD-related protein [Pseudomonadota bacterium]